MDQEQLLIGLQMAYDSKMQEKKTCEWIHRTEEYHFS